MTAEEKGTALLAEERASVLADMTLEELSGV